MKDFFSLCRATFDSWSAHQVPRMGAALAYYTVLSLAPLVVIVVGLLGLVVEQNAARADVVAQFSALVGKAGGETVETILTHGADQKAGLWTAVLGFATLLLGASGVFAELQESLNLIWGVPPGAWSWRTMIRERLLSVAMVFVLGFLVLVSLLASAAISALGASLKDWAPGFDFVWESVNSIVSLLVITVMFAGLFRFLPDVEIAWRDVWIGAAITSALFVLGKFLLGFYLGRSAFASAYGAAGSLVIVLLWVYYSAQIFFFGAEFTRTFSQRHGSRRGSSPREPQEA